jgi:hypothetical protein
MLEHFAAGAFGRHSDARNVGCAEDLFWNKDGPDKRLHNGNQQQDCAQDAEPEPPISGRAGFAPPLIQPNGNARTQDGDTKK